jgi:hypothetical protein
VYHLLLFVHVRPANQSAITVVALCHKKLAVPWLIQCSELEAIGKLSRFGGKGRAKNILKYPQFCHNQYKNELYYSVENYFVPLHATCMFLPGRIHGI